MYDERDSRATPVRTQIQRLYEMRGIVPTRIGYRCASLPQCTEAGRISLHTGNWVFVGSEYGSAEVSGLAAKILFVAMDRGGYGGADEERFADAQSAFRRAIELPQNPHMGGAALMLKHLTDERDPRKLSGLCALTNAVKCAQHTGSMTTNATPQMIAQCAAHLRAEIHELQPDIVITQGGHPTDTILATIAGLRTVAEFAGERKGRTRVLVNSRIVVLTTPHPARQEGLKWSRGILPQFFLDAISVARGELILLLQQRQASGDSPEGA